MNCLLDGLKYKQGSNQTREALNNENEQIIMNWLAYIVLENTQKNKCAEGISSVT